jgi:hypothetical protein
MNSIYLSSPDGVSWTGDTGAIQGILYGITYASAGGYVAVGRSYDGDVLYLRSLDGVTWTGGIASIPGGYLYGITYDVAGGYIAVGQDNYPYPLYLSSPDGVSWTGGTGSAQGGLNAMTYGSAGGYMAIGFNENGNITRLSSPDGVSWTDSTIYFSISSTIIKTSITTDKLIDNIGSTGAPGQVLTAGPTGSGLMWANPNMSYNPAYPAYWESPAPATVQQALDRISKYIYTASSAEIPL